MFNTRNMGAHRTSSNFQTADYCENKRSKFFYSSFIFSFFYSEDESFKSKLSMRE